MIARDRVIGEAAKVCHPERVGAHAAASRRTPTLSDHAHVASGSSQETLARSSEWTIKRDHPITRFLQLIRAVLREIFDESAYERFLLRTKASHSGASYRDFMRERAAAMSKKPRCC